MRPDLVLADQDLAVELEPLNPRWRNNACWARAIQGFELDAALSLCDEAIRLAELDDPSGINGSFHDSRALVYLKLSRPADALRDYDHAMQRPGPHFQYGRGIALMMLGRKAEADADLKAALKEDPFISGTFVNHGFVVLGDGKVMVDRRSRAARVKWARKPTPAELADVFPVAAARTGQTGRAAIVCIAKADGRFAECGVTAEVPAGLGFGAAAMAVVPLFQLEPTVGSDPVEGTWIAIPISFQF